jgi:hypothetical protein
MNKEIWKDKYKILIGEEKFLILERFLNCVEAIENRRFFQKSHKPYPDIIINNEESSKHPKGIFMHSYEHGDLEELRSAILSIRPILSPNEDIFINKIKNFLIIHEDESQRIQIIKDSFKKIKNIENSFAVFKGKLDMPPNKNNRNKWLTKKELLYNTFNECLFHWDKNKLNAVNLNNSNSLKDTCSDIIKKGELIIILTEEANFAFWFANFIKTKGSN